MAMNQGYWIQKATGKTWEVHEHCEFAKSPAGAAAMGLPEQVQQAIAPLNCQGGFGPERNEICIAVMKAGFIRMRGHGHQYSFEFWGDTRESLWAILEFCNNMAGPYTWMVINNLKSNEQYASNFEDFQKRMKEDEDEVLRIASTLLKNPATPPASCGG
jgi:hypothetical protein